MGDKHRLSILIVCYNEEKNILRLLRSLSKQLHSDRNSEILIADNGSSDSTVQICKTFFKTNSNCAGRIFQRTENNLAAARNQLILQAQNELCLFLDADCQVASNYLASALQSFRTLQKKHVNPSKLAGLGGTQFMPSKTQAQKALNLIFEISLMRLFSSHRGASCSELSRQITPTDHLPTTNALFLRSAVLSVNGFNEKYQFVGEDLDLGLRLNAAGWGLWSCERFSVENEAAEDHLGWIYRMFRFGSAQAEVFGRRKGWITIYLTVFPAFLFSSFAFNFQIAGIFLFSGMCGWWLLLFGKALQSNRLSNSLTLATNALLVSLTSGLSYWFGFISGLFLRLYRGANIRSHLKPRPSH